MTPTETETDPRVRQRMDEVMRHARRTFRHTTQSRTPSRPLVDFDLDGSLHGAPPWTVEFIERQPGRLWSPASWFATLAVAGAVPLVIVYWMLH
ncbi:MAG: hypothetical protein AAGA48_21575 [Myxococcota bacterium]